MSPDQGTLPDLAEAALALGYSLDEAIAEKTEEMRSRAVIASIPNRTLNGTDHRLFVQAVLSSTPPPWLLAASSRQISGRIAMSVDVKLRLEEQQRWRCALCGLPLARDVSPQWITLFRFRSAAQTIQVIFSSYAEIAISVRATCSLGSWERPTMTQHYRTRN